MNKNLLLKFFLLAGDVALMYGALFLVLAFRYGDFSVFPGPQSWDFVFHFSLIYLFWLGLLHAFDFYDFSREKNIALRLKNAVLFAAFAFAAGAVYFYLNSHSLISPKTILFADVILVSVFVFLRALLAGRFIFGKNFEKRIAVVGWCPEMEELARDYLPAANFRIAAIFRPDSFDGMGGADVFSKEADFVRAVAENNVEAVVFAAPADRQDLPEAIAGLDINIKIFDITGFYEEIAGKIPLRLVNKLWIMEAIPRAPRKGYAAAKRTIDALFAFIALAVAAPFLPLVALAVKIDSPGPVLYVQKRKGRGGKIFHFYKFRTMTATKDQHLIFRANDENQVTGVGKVLRKTHIDEFPQLFNILRGDMSFAGPRPEWEKLAADYEKNIPLYRYRYLVRPGFTGWAQINYKASASIKEAREKFEYDLYYIKNRSFLLDISILLKTLQLFFR